MNEGVKANFADFASKIDCHGNVCPSRTSSLHVAVCQTMGEFPEHLARFNRSVRGARKPWGNLG